jgi:hypothetical protein
MLNRAGVANATDNKEASGTYDKQRLPSRVMTNHCLFRKEETKLVEG